MEPRAQPVEFVLSVNVKRRHLTPSQRAAIGVAFLPALEDEAAERQRVLGRERGGRPSGSRDPEGVEPNSHRAREDAGALVGVESSVAMHCRLAGLECHVIEEDTFYNGNTIPEEARCGCYVIHDGAQIPMLKIEAGW